MDTLHIPLEALISLNKVNIILPPNENHNIFTNIDGKEYSQFIKNIGLNNIDHVRDINNLLITIDNLGHCHYLGSHNKEDNNKLMTD